MTDQTYRYGHLQRKGVLLGLRWAQLALCVTALFSLIPLLNLAAGGLAGPAFVWGIVIVLLMLAAFVRVQHKGLDEWAKVAAGHVVQRLRGETLFRGGLFRRRPGQMEIDSVQLPGLAQSLIFKEMSDGAGGTIAVVYDPRERTWTGVLRVRGIGFSLLDKADQEKQVSDWGQLLGSICTSSPQIIRVAWMERTIPDSGDSFQRHWNANGVQDDSFAARAYEELITIAGPTAQRHETYIVFTMGARLARGAISRAGGGDEGALAVLYNELRSCERQITEVGLQAAGWLRPRDLATVVRTTYDPASIEAIDQRDHDPETGLPYGVDAQAMGPLRGRKFWDYYQTDSAMHRVWWVPGLPRREVAAAFHYPVVLQATCRRTVTVVAEPVGPKEAEKELERQMTAHFTEQQTRNKVGKRTTQRDEQEVEQTERKIAELLDGHGVMRFSMFIHASADSYDDLEVTTGDIEALANKARLEVLLLVGEQDQAVQVAALPLGMGVH